MSSLMHLLRRPASIETLLQPVLRRTGRNKFEEAWLEVLSRGPEGTNLEEASILFSYARAKRQERDIDLICIDSALEMVKASDVSARLSVNVHASTLTRKTTREALIAQLTERAPAPPIIEVVEYGNISQNTRMLEAILQLKDLGIGIAIDDVGARSSNIDRILLCEPDYLKIDGPLVRSIGEDPRGKTVLSFFVDLAAATDCQLVAEGVETADQLQALEDLGIRLFQGYLFCPPLRRDRWLSRAPRFSLASESQGA